MKYRLIVQHEAEADVTDAAVWYERKRARLGHAFLAEVEATFDKIVEDPLRFPLLRSQP